MSITVDDRPTTDEARDALAATMLAERQRANVRMSSREIRSAVAR